MARWFIAAEFVHSCYGQCHLCKGVTLSFIDKDWKNWCLNCFGNTELSYGKEKTISKGKFFCPAKSCKSLLNFESFIKGECCDVARPMGMKDRFAEIGENFKEIKTLSSAATLEIVSEELDNFIDEFKNFFPKTDRNTCSICIEKYGSKCIECCLPSCGHRFCFDCLTNLQNKNCPSCRKMFSNKQIIKLF
ncbi:unnamed protein product [Oikopleura dioica]|uniref:RING-type domain-containing protein n=1 Tax=Oikopleura dioica TaxID=34765 RepID=E4YU38_OIKDI|nr:unnamed protein product [Oikopleura dioica]